MSLLLKSKDSEPALDQGHILSINLVTGEVSVSMRNGLVSAAKSLYDVSLLSVGSTVLVGKVNNSYIIFDTVATSSVVAVGYTVDPPT